MGAPSPPEGPRYQPYDGRAHRLRMGLRPLASADWLQVDGHRDADLAEKRRLLAECPEQVLAIVEDPDGRVRAASEELRRRVLANLAEHHRDVDVATPVGAAHPIDAAGRSTQEDWCLHLPDPQGRWRLVAASVCFPTRWDLTTKIGRTVREIHAPVSRYREQLADPVDAFFGRMRPEQSVWRLNWNLLDEPALHQPSTVRTGAPVRTDAMAERWWLRVERQTLVRLPASGAIVFGIRIHLDPLAALAGDPEGRARLAAALECLSPEALRDRGLEQAREPVLEWLRSPSAGT